MIQTNSIYHGFVREEFKEISTEGLYRKVTTSTKDGYKKQRQQVTQPDRYYFGFMPDNFAIVICDDYGKPQSSYIGLIEALPSDVRDNLPNIGREYLPFMLNSNIYFFRIFIATIMCIFTLIGILLLSQKASYAIKSFCE